MPAITRTPFGATRDGRTVELFTLSNGPAAVQILTYGGIVRSITVPDRRGELANVVLGLTDLESYVQANAYLGCITGRYANRIARGRFTLDGIEHRLAVNDPPNHLHGGNVGFDKATWAATELDDAQDVGLRLEHTSPDGDEGYPGTLTVRVDYRLSGSAELRIDTAAETDAPTIVNVCNHSFFNLAGEGTGDVDAHELVLHAGSYLPVDPTQIPRGSAASVAGTPMDFRAPRRLGDRAGDPFEQLAIGGGYDHTWVIDREGPGLVPAARVAHRESGRTLEVATTEPGIQVYPGNRFDGSVSGMGGAPYGPGAGLALETQHFPDSPNRPDFPSTVLRPGERYETTTVLRFGLD
jgi:aldose 1-epimerase